MSYLIAGKEVAPQTGTLHFQIYLETKKKESMKALHATLTTLWKTPPHLEVSKGSGDQNIQYCKKAQDFTEFGSQMKPGARTDLSDVSAAIVSGSTLAELWTEFPVQMIKYHGGIEKCYQMTSPHSNGESLKKFSLMDFPANFPSMSIMKALETTSVILWGESGTGKTSYARALLPNALFVSHMDDFGKYDTGTYEGIIIDDMSMTHLHREAQIHMFDVDQPRSIHIRYKTANIPAGTKKIFTTNNPYGAIYNVGDKALERRITKFEIKEWDKEVLHYVPPEGLLGLADLADQILDEQW